MYIITDLRAARNPLIYVNQVCIYPLGYSPSN